MWYRFSDADRERLGVTDEWVEVDLSRLMFDEAVGLEEAGYDADEFLDDFRGYPIERDGKPVMVDVVAGDGKPVLGEDGKPEQVQKRRRPAKAMGAAAWIAARRGGSTVSFADFTYDMIGLEAKAGTQGKGDSPDPASGS